MSERVKELEKECWSHRVDGVLVDGHLHFDTKKFADLIIDDVLAILADRKNYNSVLYTTWDVSRADCIVHDIAKAIQTKFGTTKNFKVEDNGIMGRKISS